ncbi:MAG: zinc ribbon domain-containing protein [Planctomycetota bacterium]
MPTYQYHCTDNQKTLEVIHGMTRNVETWGDLCALAEHDPGQTPADTPVERLMGTGMVLPQKPDPASSGSAFKGCGCSGACHH